MAQNPNKAGSDGPRPVDQMRRPQLRLVCHAAYTQRAPGNHESGGYTVRGEAI